MTPLFARFVYAATSHVLVSHCKNSASTRRSFCFVSDASFVYAYLLGVESIFALSQPMAPSTLMHRDDFPLYTFIPTVYDPTHTGGNGPVSFLSIFFRATPPDLGELMYKINHRSRRLYPALFFFLPFIILCASALDFYFFRPAGAISCFIVSFRQGALIHTYMKHISL